MSFIATKTGVIKTKPTNIWTPRKPILFSVFGIVCRHKVKGEIYIGANKRLWPCCHLYDESIAHKNNTFYYLNNIPFADHGALLDPPTADVSARCVSMLSQIDKKNYKNVIQKGVRFLKNEQEKDGSWFGRWGANYIYGTWSVLHALKAAGEDMDANYIKKSIAWIKNKQNKDGGWGEDCATYWKEKKNMPSIESMPSQTSWAILSLLITEKINDPSIEKGVKFLKKNFDKKKLWVDNHFNAVGFPKVFYITYHGYAKYFTNWALSRYKNLKEGNKTNRILGL